MQKREKSRRGKNTLDDTSFGTVETNWHDPMTRTADRYLCLNKSTFLVESCSNAGIILKLVFFPRLLSYLRIRGIKRAKSFYLVSFASWIFWRGKMFCKICLHSDFSKICGFYFLKIYLNEDFPWFKMNFRIDEKISLWNMPLKRLAQI